MIGWKCILLFLLLIVFLPLLYGSALRIREEGLLMCWAKGYLVAVASAYFPGVACAAFQQSLTLFLLIWGGVLFALAAVSAAMIILRLQKGTYPRRAKRAKGKIRHFRVLFAEWVMAALILVQSLIPVFFMHIDDDDATYVGMATVAVDTDTVYSYNPYTGREIRDLTDKRDTDVRRYVISPLYTFYAGVSYLTGIRPAVLCHTSLPGLLIFMSCIIYYMIGRRLFPEDREKTAVFSVFVSTLNICSYISVYLSGTFLLIRVWQGKGQFAGIVMPMLLYLFLSLGEKSARKGEKVEGEERILWLTLFLIMISAMITTPMGNMLAVVLAGLFGLILTIRRRRAWILLRTAICVILPTIAMACYLMYLRI